mmetsp:Transcript_25692/g.82990  ORF Transcript_25692/g.82990 Transcript_25692/m.82990 type:complete len:102 (-) Transcript_25692:1281-1586(-)
MADGTAKRIEGGRGQVVLFVIWRLEKQNSASAWRVTMAPRQLRLEPIEADSTADKGAKRVRVDSTEESSTQMVPSSSDPFLPTAAELAGDDPAVRPMDFCL